jgi:hypothetical protein
MCQLVGKGKRGERGSGAAGSRVAGHSIDDDETQWQKQIEKTEAITGHHSWLKQLLSLAVHSPTLIITMSFHHSTHYVVPLFHISLWRVHVLSALTSAYPKKTNKQSDRHEAIWSALNHLANAMQCQAFRLAFINFLSCFSIMFYLIWPICFSELGWLADEALRRRSDSCPRESGAARDPRHSQTFPDIPRLNGMRQKLEKYRIEPSWTYISVNVTHWPRSLCRSFY